MQTLREVRFHGQPGFELASERLAIVVLPDFGGRVASLVDRAIGREWLVQGRPPSRDVTDDGADYDADVAWGWDECLPTVAPCPDPGAPHRRLRDHGDVWGRPLRASPDGPGLRLALDVGDGAGDRPSYAFRRSVRVDGTTVRVDYDLENRGTAVLPVLWSMHPLAALEPGCRLHAPGITELVATFTDGGGLAGLVPRGGSVRIAWPAAVLPSGATYDLASVPGPGAAEAIKLYAGPLTTGTAALSAPDGAWLGCRWDAATAPFLGIWISNGGWPSPPAGVVQHALEPTTAPADSLASATDQDCALLVMPGERRTWWAELAVGAPPESLDEYLATDGQRRGSPLAESAAAGSSAPLRARDGGAGISTALGISTGSRRPSPASRRVAAPGAPAHAEGVRTSWPISTN